MGIPRRSGYLYEAAARRADLRRALAGSLLAQRVGAVRLERQNFGERLVGPLVPPARFRPGPKTTKELEEPLIVRPPPPEKGPC